MEEEEELDWAFGSSESGGGGGGGGGSEEEEEAVEKRWRREGWFPRVRPLDRSRSAINGGAGAEVLQARQEVLEGEQ